MDIDTIQATSLLFCACFDSFTSDMFALLLKAGLSTKFSLQLFTNDAEPIAESCPFWLVLVNLVVSRAMNYFTDESELQGGFEIIEMVLDIEEKSGVLIITRQQSDYSGLDFAISLRDFVCGLRPLNMQRLLELLPVSDFPRPQQEQVLDRWRTEHSQDGPLRIFQGKHTKEYQHRDFRSLFLYRGLVSNNYTIHSQHKMPIFRLWLAGEESVLI